MACSTQESCNQKCSRDFYCIAIVETIFPSLLRRPAGGGGVAVHAVRRGRAQDRRGRLQHRPAPQRRHAQARLGRVQAAARDLAPRGRPCRGVGPGAPRRRQRDPQRAGAARRGMGHDRHTAHQPRRLLPLQPARFGQDPLAARMDNFDAGEVMRSRIASAGRRIRYLER